MPVTDVIFTIFGVISYASVFGVVLWTGYRTRKDASKKNIQEEAAPADKQDQPPPSKTKPKR